VTLIAEVEKAGGQEVTLFLKAPMTIVAVSSNGQVVIGELKCEGGCRLSRPIRLRPRQRLRIAGSFPIRLLTLEWGLVTLSI